MLTVDGLRAGYQGGTVLHDIHLRAPRPGVHVLVGHNGAGKTTVLHSIAGLIRPYHGIIRFNRVDLAGRPAHQIARAGLALVPQGRRVWASLTVHDHLQAGRSRLGRNPAGVVWTAGRLLRLFPPLAARLHHRGGLLSGGEQQMLAIARALLTQPRLLLLDEPVEGLAPALARQILEVITALPAAGITVLAAFPDAATALRIASHLTVIVAGRVTAEIPGATARANPALLHEHLNLPTRTATPAGPGK